MKRWLIFVVVAMGAAACVSPQPLSDYELWREFRSAVGAMDATRLAAYYRGLHKQLDQQPSDLRRLQLAHLLIEERAQGASTPALRAEARSLLEGVSAGSELAPLRDPLWQLLTTQEQLQETRAQLAKSQKTLQSQGASCELTQQRLLALRTRQDTLLRDADSCLEQLDALKRIESTLSDAPADLSGSSNNE
ncbi:MAG: hypothetical protein AAF662_08095 [Pseudomonadota bacterium]